MKTKSYKHGKHTYKSYYKKAGNGYEVGFKVGTKFLFFGNFLHSREANEWYTKMNKEIEMFSKRYWITPKAPKTFYNKFISNHLHKVYYAYLDKQFTRYNRTFKSAWNQDERKYKRMKKNFDVNEKIKLKRAV